MTSQRSIVEDWRARLDEYEREVADPAKPRTWVVRAYAKVLRFLLSFYGGSEPTALNTDAVERDRPSMDLTVVEPIGPGKPARDSETVRHTIGSIHDANAPNAKSGPLIAGLRPGDVILLDSFQKWVDLDSCLTVLEKLGIKPQFEQDGQWTRVTVRYKDHAKARAALDEHRRSPKPPNRRIDPHALEYDWRTDPFRDIFARFFIRIVPAGFGIPVGGTIGYVVAICTGVERPAADSIIFSGAILGAAIGFWFAGRLLRSPDE